MNSFIFHSFELFNISMIVQIAIITHKNSGRSNVTTSGLQTLNPKWQLQSTYYI